ncbi:MAG TPA: hypothetical protein VFZ28_12715 [Burkholderiaceae bacterium]|nr:hypothetical protein [Burkholderiaceae bacterium]
MRAILFSGLIWMAAALALAAEPIVKQGVVLLQPSTILEQRVASVDAMAGYIKAVEAAAREAVQGSAVKQATGGFIVIAVKPGLKSKVWLDFDALLDPDTSRQLAARITAVEPFEARQGPVVFALKVSLWGGRESRRVAPAPADWKAATKQAGRQLDIDGMIQRVWREPDA